MPTTPLSITFYQWVWKACSQGNLRICNLWSVAVSWAWESELSWTSARPVPSWVCVIFRCLCVYHVCIVCSTHLRRQTSVNHTGTPSPTLSTVLLLWKSVCVLPLQNVKGPLERSYSLYSYLLVQQLSWDEKSSDFVNYRFGLSGQWHTQHTHTAHCVFLLLWGLKVPCKETPKIHPFK